MPRATFETYFDASPEAVFGFHERPEALRLLTPWWSGARVAQPPASLRSGERARILLGVPPLRIEWLAEHRAYDPPRLFEDIQLQGPFRRWCHRHYVWPRGRGARLRDEVDYEPPGGPLAPIVDRLVLRPFLTRLFRHRHAATRRWLAQSAPQPAAALSEDSGRDRRSPAPPLQ